MIGKIRGHGDKTSWWIDGREVSQAEFEEHFPPACSLESVGTCGSSLVGFKAIHSDALGVHPKQITEARESAIKKGVPTEFDKKGRPIFTSRLHRKRYCEAYGYFDRDGGYGDAQRKTSRTKTDETLVKNSYDSLLDAVPKTERGNVIEAVRAAMKRHGL